MSAPTAWETRPMGGYRRIHRGTAQTFELVVTSTGAWGVVAAGVTVRHGRCGQMVDACEAADLAVVGL